MPRHELPPWQSVLAVVAHPDDESFGLGGLLAGFATSGARVTVLCLTHGEASSLHAVPGDLHRVRSQELAAAAEALGARSALLLGYPDGTLGSTCGTVLAGDVVDAARDAAADGLLVFDPSGVTGHPDHVAATDAALAAADVLDLPVLGWTLPADVAEQLNQERGTAFRGHRDEEIDYEVTVARVRQLAAVRAHASQALPTSVLWRRLELLRNREHLRQLRDPGNTPPARAQNPEVTLTVGRAGELTPAAPRACRCLDAAPTILPS